MRAALFLVSIALALASCADAPFRVEYGWNEQRALSYTWLEPTPVIGEPAYCYRTLAEPDCYRRSQPREASRLVGHIGPEPY
jgi:hypothetical protein